MLHKTRQGCPGTGCGVRADLLPELIEFVRSRHCNVFITMSNKVSLLADALGSPDKEPIRQVALEPLLTVRIRPVDEFIEAFAELAFTSWFSLEVVGSTEHVVNLFLWDALAITEWVQGFTFAALTIALPLGYIVADFPIATWVETALA